MLANAAASVKGGRRRRLSSLFNLVCACFVIEITAGWQAWYGRQCCRASRRHKTVQFISKYKLISYSSINNLLVILRSYWRHPAPVTRTATEFTNAAQLFSYDKKLDLSIKHNKRGCNEKTSIFDCLNIGYPGICRN